MDEVKDLEVYVRRMEKSLMDKLFFVDKIYEPVNSILDFGCANGVLIQTMQRLFPEYNYVGYDISPEMLQQAKINAPEAVFYEDWDQISLDFSGSLLNISSTVHEVYAYGNEASVAQFWDRVFHSGFRYIAIRDMMLTENLPDEE